MCVAAPAGTKLNNAVLLGTSRSGGLSFLEPAGLVGLNNELLAARAEALSAEENVLWELSGRLMGVLDDVQTVCVVFHVCVCVCIVCVCVRARAYALSLSRARTPALFAAGTAPKPLASSHPHRTHSGL